jgi:hypothetical protein
MQLTIEPGQGKQRHPLFSSNFQTMGVPDLFLESAGAKQ